MSKTQFSTPGNYRIEVEGVLPAAWLDRLGAMRVFTPSLKTNKSPCDLFGVYAYLHVFMTDIEE